ncbi:MAG TPA: methyltransferase [Gemmatimonadaceae bacterium]|jgi:methylase of polypeptide subunit release factors
MPLTTERAWTGAPFRDLTQVEFRRLRQLFLRLGYAEAALSARYQLESVRELLLTDQNEVHKVVLPDDATSMLVKLFLRNEQLAWSVVRGVLGASDIEILTDSGILHSVHGHPDLCVTTIAILPVEELFLAADRLEAFESVTGEAPADLVYSPITSQTVRFMALMPRDPCEHLLDIGTGSGVLGLYAAAHFARQVTAVDIAERSVRFTRFNAALNDLTNVRVLQGDLYEPVRGEQFDVILAHPPYVPATETEFVFRDGGEDGEHITRGLLTGLSRHLRPDGKFFCKCMLTDRRGAPVQDRLREMLGDDGDEFDIVIAQEKTLDPLYFFADKTRTGDHSYQNIGQWNETVNRLEIQEMVLLAMLLERHSADRPAVTTRRVQSPFTTAADMRWILRWLAKTVTWDMADWRRLLASRPRILPRTHLRSRSTLKDGQWSVDECTLVTHAPFAIEASCPTWYATLLQFCDGRMTAREHLQYLRDTHAVPDSASEEAFTMMIRQLVDAGLVEIEEFRLPDATALRENDARERSTGSRSVERAD